MPVNKILLAALAVLLSLNLSAQKYQNPFSQYGLGTMQDQTFARYRGMSGASVAVADDNYYNLSNPASYSFMKSFDYETALHFDLYNLKSPVQDFTNLYFQVPYLSLAFPMDSGRGIGASFGLLPYSKTGFFIQEEETSPVDVKHKLEGTGEINKVYAGISFRILKNVYVGGDASYLFGNKEVYKEDSFSSGELFNTASLTTTYVNDLVFKGGALYTPKFKNGFRMNLGFSSEFGTNLKARREFNAAAFRNSPTVIDTIIDKSVVRGSVYLPAKYNVGINIGKTNKWQLEADVTYRRWSDFSILDQNQGFEDQMSFALGSEWIPINSSSNNPLYTKVGNYLRRTRYRAGLSYTMLPYTISGTQPTDMGASIGFGFPIMKKGETIENASMLDLSIQVGQLGNTDETVIQKQYIIFTLGLHLFESDWFFRRKID